jgi:hypothetical protein
MISYVHDIIYTIDDSMVHLSLMISYIILVKFGISCAVRSWDDIMCSVHKVSYLRPCARIIWLLLLITWRALGKRVQEWDEGCATSALEPAARSHTVPTHHMKSTSTLVAKFSLQTPTSETYVNTVKLTVFGVKDGAPILAEDHPVNADMAKTMKCAFSMLCFIQMMSLTPTVCCHSLLDSCSFRRRQASLRLGGFHLGDRSDPMRPSLVLGPCACMWKRTWYHMLYHVLYRPWYDIMI